MNHNNVHFHETAGFNPVFDVTYHPFLLLSHQRLVYSWVFG